MSVDVATLSLKVDSTDVKGATSAMDRMTSVGSGLEGVVKKVVAAWASWKVVEYAREAATLAARYETLGVVMGAVGRNAGYSQGQMALYAQALQQTGISAIESRNVLTMMAGAQMDLAKSSDMARIAQDAAVIGNINSSEAFQRMVQGIRSGETEILRTIGISVNFEQAYQKMGQTLSKTAKDLTDLEKLQARQNVVMEYGTKIAGAYEASMGTAGKQALSMTRYLEDLQVKVGEAFLPAFSESVMTLTGALKEANEWIGSNRSGITDLAQSMNSAVVSVESFLGMLSQITGGSGTASDALEGLSTVFRGIGLTIATSADLIQTAVGDLAVVVGSLANIPGMDNPIYKWGKEQINGATALDKFLDSVEQGQDKVSAAAVKTEQLASAQEAVNKYTAEYTRLKGAMERAGDNSKENQELLEQLGLWKDIFTFKLASIQAGTPEEMGPVAPIASSGTIGKRADGSAAKAIEAYKKQLASLNSELDKERIAMEQGATAAYRYSLAMQGISKQDADALIAKKTTNDMIKDAIDLDKKLLDGRLKIIEADGSYAQGVLQRMRDAARVTDQFLNPKEAFEKDKAYYSSLNLDIDTYKAAIKSIDPVWTDTFGSMARTLDDFSMRGTDAFVEFCFTGKAQFSDLVTSMLRDLARLTVQKNVMGPLFDLLGVGINYLAGGGSTGNGNLGSQGLPSTFLGTGTGGGLTGSGGLNFNDSTGSGFSMPTPVPAPSGQIVNQISVTVQSDGSVKTSSEAGAKGSAIAKELEGLMDAWAVKQSRTGGLLARG